MPHVFCDLCAFRISYFPFMHAVLSHLCYFSLDALRILLYGDAYKIRAFAFFCVSVFWEIFHATCFLPLTRHSYRNPMPLAG